MHKTPVVINHLYYKPTKNNFTQVNVARTLMTFVMHFVDIKCFLHVPNPSNIKVFILDFSR